MTLCASWVLIAGKCLRPKRFYRKILKLYVNTQSTTTDKQTLLQKLLQSDQNTIFCGTCQEIIIISLIKSKGSLLRNI